MKGISPPKYHKELIALGFEHKTSIHKENNTTDHHYSYKGTLLIR